MPQRLTKEQLLQLARMGAEKRIEDLRAEIRAIEALVGRRSAAVVGGGGRKRRPHWTAAQRKAAAERMKAYWANRKAKRK
jgi:hypothetical protein